MGKKAVNNAQSWGWGEEVVVQEASVEKPGWVEFAAVCLGSFAGHLCAAGHV